jgi:hypothetical protein
MGAALRLCHIVFWLGLVLWISALVSAAVAAMNVFPGMDRLPLTLDAYTAYPSDEHPRLAAGMLMEGVFVTVDLLQLAAAPLVLAALLAHHVVFRLKWRRPAHLVRAACILAAAGMLAWHVTVLAPRMNRALHRFHEAAAAGDVATARGHRAAFNTDHPTADAILRLELGLLIVAAAASAVGLGPALHPREAGAGLDRPRLLDDPRASLR